LDPVGGSVNGGEGGPVPPWCVSIFTDAEAELFDAQRRRCLVEEGFNNIKEVLVVFGLPKEITELKING